MRHLLVMVYPLATLLGFHLAGYWVFLTGAISGVALLLLDGLLPVLSSGRTLSYRPGSARGAEAVLWIYPAVHLAVLLTACHYLSTQDYLWWELAGLSYGLGLLGGACAFPVAHELIHRRETAARVLGTALLALPLYMHFRIEHVHGHHRHVASPADPATARLGESLYHFFRRSCVGGYLSAWRIELARLRRRQHACWGWRNRMLWYAAIQLSWLATVFAWFGPLAGTTMLIAAALAIFLLETINYIEHYGLQRRYDPSTQRYERVSSRHSWDCAQAATNAALFNLGLHSSHHADIRRPFTQLRAGRNNPTLPAGYFFMAALALFPPLWRRVMDPRAEFWLQPHLPLDQGPAP